MVLCVADDGIGAERLLPSSLQKSKWFFRLP